jgi:hypothetical protein
VSAETAATLRTLAFGDLDAGAWGCAWGASAPQLALGTPQAQTPLPGAPVSIGGSLPGEDWTVAADGVELTVSPEAESLPASSSAIPGFDQLVRVRGRAVVAGAERQIDLPGRRGIRPGLDLSQLESIREVCAWFAPGDGIALTALRPRGAKGHDRDAIGACVFEPGAGREVADARLSTTYTGDGHPVKVGLELWLDLDDSDQQYPRRAGGEALSAGAAWAQPGLGFEAHLLRCQSRGEEGVGVYLLGRLK